MVNANLVLAGTGGGGASGVELMWVAPIGSTAPVNAVDDLPAAWESVGYVSADGASLGVAESSQDITAFGTGVPVRTLVTASKHTVSVTCLETNPTVLEVFSRRELGAVIPDAQGDFGYTEGTVPTRRYAIVIELVDGENRWRRYYPSAEVTGRQEQAIATGEAATYGLTITAYPGTDGVAVVNFYRIPGLVEEYMSGLWEVRSVTASTDATADDLILANATSGPISITLPSVAGGNSDGVSIAIKKTDSSTNAVTIVGIVDGATNPTLTIQNHCIFLACDGTMWRNVSTTTPAAIGAAPAIADYDAGETPAAKALTVDGDGTLRIGDGATAGGVLAGAAAFEPAVVLTGAGIDLTGATDSTAAIQALLTANPGKTIRSVPGATYKITSTLTCYSGQHLALTGGTFSLIGCADEMLVNSAAITPQRTVADAATTAASTTITSATAAFTSADVGRAVVIATAGPSGGTLAANIASVTNATTAVLDTAAIGTVTGQSMSIYDRDTNITVEGGTFLRDATASVAHMLHFRRVDNLTVRPDRVVTSGGKYSVSFGHVTDFQVSGGSWTTHSDGVHVNGPAKRGLICGMRGTSGDDFVALTANDYAAYADVAGDISDIVIDNISRTAASHGAGNTVKVLAGENCKVRNVAIDGITGTSQRNIVALIDDSFGPSTLGQDIDGITIGSIVGVPATGYSLLSIAGAGVGAVSVGQVILGKAATGAEIGINIGEAVTGLCLHVGTIATPTAASNNLLNILAGAAWTAIMVDRIQGVFKADRTAGRSISIASASGPISVGQIVQTGGRMIVQFNAATGTQPLTIGAIHSTNIADGIWVSNGGSLNLDLGTWAGEEPWNRCIDVSGTGGVLNATVAGSRIVGNKFLLRSGSPGTIRINGATAQVDCTLLTPLAGDVVYNTNASAACGVGLVTSDGTTWRRVDSGAIRTGVATLSSGTVTVADAAITANSVIRIGTKTIGGTPGAVYVSARTAGASFAITSTSATDTSVVQYWIDAY